MYTNNNIKTFSCALLKRLFLSYHGKNTKQVTLRNVTFKRFQTYQAAVLVATDG